MQQTKGKVILAGAGPGDADLITVKLQKYLAIANVILTDRLVNPAIIEQYANTSATVIYTGKQGFNENSSSQEEINHLIVHYALQTNIVLRLKGGDVAFFSNVLDELQAIVQHEIDFEIIPGITAASGASAYAGIPLTARGYAQGVKFLTYNPNTNYAPEAWKEFATSSDTLVFYMAAKNVVGLAEILLRYTRKPNTPLALIEQATTPFQQIHFTTLTLCSRDFNNKTFASPSIVIIGNVVELHSKFSWFKSLEISGTIFKELSVNV